MEQRKLGKYDIRNTLGRGAMGVVYDGWDPIITRRVAIKTVRLPDDSDPETAESLTRCKREAQAAGRLNHPNIVGVFDYGETGDVAYIVMEFVDGRTLKTVLDGGARLVPAEIARVMGALLAGLQYSHDRGVVHRDIKPANIMLTDQGQVKIADFGIARIENSNMTQVGTVIGTPAYMSPEQFMGHTVDRRTDIYSAGVLLYQLITGERPFDGSMTAIMHKALHTEPRPPSALSATSSPALDAVVARAMSKRPEDRFDSADAFARALRDAFADPRTGAAGDAEATVVQVPRTRPVRAVPQRSFGRVVLIGALVFGVGTGTAAWFLTGPHKAVKQTDQLPATPNVTTTAVAPDVSRSPPVAVTEVPSPQSTVLPVPPPPEAAQVTAQPTAALPPTTATVTNTAPASPVRIGAAEAQTLALTIPCSLLDVSDRGSANTPDRLLIAGPILPSIAFNDFIGQIRRPDRLLDVATDRLEPGQCPALTMIADRVRHSRITSRLEVITPDAPVVAGGRLTIIVRTVPDGALYVDLYAPDGSVHHFARRSVPQGSGGKPMEVTGAAPAPPGQYLLVALAVPAQLDLAQRPAHENSGPYLSVVQSELARGAANTSEPRAEAAMVTIVAGARPVASAPGPASTASAQVRLPGLNAARCADIVARVQLWEALSDAERSVLQSSCGR